MVSVPLEWKLSIKGSQEVKTRLSEINSQFQRGEISASEYAKELRGVNRDARSLVGTTTLQKNIFLATHPTFNLMARGASTLASVSRTLLAITNAINLARLAGQGISSQQLEIEAEIARVLRAISRETDPENLQLLNEELAILNAKLKELTDEQGMQNFLNFITGIGVAGAGLGGFVNAFQKLAPSLSLLSSVSIAGVSAGVIALAGAFAAVAIAGFLAGQELFKILNVVFGLEKEMQKLKVFLTIFFDRDIPILLDSVVAGFRTAWDVIIGLTEGFVNGIITGIETMINGFITAINVMIRAYNSAAKVLGLPKISTIAAVSLPRLDLGGVKPQESNNQIQPIATGQGVSGQQIQIFNIEGSILAENELLEIVDNDRKTKLRQRGFR